MSTKLRSTGRGIAAAFFLILVATLAAIKPSSGQLQQSGGPGANVSVVQGGHTATVTASNAILVDLSATAANATAIKVDNSGVTQPVSGTVTVNALPAGSNVIGTVDTIPKTACGNAVASQALAAVPTSSTAVFSSTTCLMAIVVNNTNSTAQTVTITDNQGTPINDVLTFSIPGNSQLIQPLWGVQFTSGVKWSAGGTGLTGALLGYQ